MLADSFRRIATDLVVAPGAMESSQLAPLWLLLQSDRFKVSVEELGGYSAKEMGRRIRPEVALVHLRNVGYGCYNFAVGAVRANGG